jgi:UDP-N-acetylglucosamine diphosphorylase/glucosamine-1-phosphate N-acetyltransferase
MKVVLYDLPAYSVFYPFFDFMPCWELRTGALSVRDRWSRICGRANLMLFPLSEHIEIAAAFAPELKVHNADSLPSDAIYISSMLVPGPTFDYAKVAESGTNPFCKRLSKNGFLELIRSGIHDMHVEGDGKEFIIVRKQWTVIEHLETLLKWDYRFFSYSSASGIQVNGPADQLRVAQSAKIGPLVVADTSHGPVVIDEEAEVKSFTLIEGPAYIGRKTILLGGKLSCCSFGENCRVAGEVANTIFHDCVNKAHHGFIGHSLVGSFTNLGAMTTNSNLKNTYGTIRMSFPTKIEETGQIKLGMICGPFTMFGIGSLIPTGAVIGGFCNLMAGGNYLPKFVDHFTWFDGLESTSYRFEQAVKTATKMAERRGRHFSAAETRRALAIYRRSYRPQR